MKTRPSLAEIRVDFSLKREVFFVVIGSVLGAVAMIIPRMLFEVGMGLPYYITWIAFGHVIGVYSPQSASAGIAIHMLTAISIGIVIGIFLYKSGILIISKVSNGLLYGLFAGSVVFIIFFIPVYQFVLAPEIIRTIPQVMPTMSEIDATKEIANNLPMTFLGSVIMHLVYGITVGFVSSLLSIKFGARYRCSKCDISFSRIDSYKKHIELIHGVKPIEQKHVLILGGGFAGIEVLKQLQKAFQNDIAVDITLVSKDNFFLFTPMLPEVSSGMIETRNIVTPIRAFCNRARFYEAKVQSIDLYSKEVIISHAIGKQTNPVDWRYHVLKYDYLVVAMGNETNFFGMEDVATHAYTIKSLGDAIVLRNHVINMLEQADIEHEDKLLKERLMTFVVVGGGFSGVETVGELNDFVRDSVKYFYHNIDEKKDLRVILVNSGGRILPEVTEDMSKFALEKLRSNGVDVILNTRLTEANSDSVKLNNGSTIFCHTIVWAGGGKPIPLIQSLPCKHDKSGKIVSNEYLEFQPEDNVAQIEDVNTTAKIQHHDHNNKSESCLFALGDCSSVIDSNTGSPYPPTAQHALRQGRIAANNIISKIRKSLLYDNNYSDTNKKIKNEKKKFDYKTKGMMALIGKRNGVGVLLRYKLHGFMAWSLWRSYYLANLPTIQKKLRVAADWILDLFFKRDVTRLKTPIEEKTSNLDNGIRDKEKTK
jgi:NADH:ubiquinone reductase (H+-translocating)